MTILQALILSIVEGITEFLPVSSTGHLILAGSLLRIAQTEFAKSFEIFIQLGAIVAVAVLYSKRLLVDKKLLLRLAFAFLPTAIVGFVLYKPIKQHLLGNPWVVIIALVIGGMFLIIWESFRKDKQDDARAAAPMTYKNAFLIGIAQSVSVIPGVSRAAATIVGGLMVGLNRTEAVEFSFLLAIPTMAAATSLDLMKSYGSFTPNDLPILGVGFVASAITAGITVKLFLQFVRSHSFIPFGIYRIILGLLFFLLFL